MRVAVCYTKDNESGHAICNHFLEGVIANGDEAIPVYDVKDIEALESCDISFQVCEYPDFMKPSHKGELRWRVQKKQKELGKRRIIADAGFIYHERKNYKKQVKKISHHLHLSNFLVQKYFYFYIDPQ